MVVIEVISDDGDGEGEVEEEEEEEEDEDKEERFEGPKASSSP